MARTKPSKFTENRRNIILHGVMTPGMVYVKFYNIGISFIEKLMAITLEWLKNKDPHTIPHHLGQ